MVEFKEEPDEEVEVMVFYIVEELCFELELKLGFLLGEVGSEGNHTA